MLVFIHTGLLSFDNGARAPLTWYFEFAKALGTCAITGSGYGDDALEISEADWPAAQSLLDEAKMLYRVQGADPQWQNVRSLDVRERLARLH